MLPKQDNFLDAFIVDFYLFQHGIYQRGYHQFVLMDYIMFKYNFNKDKPLKYQLKRCLEPEPYDTLEDAKFKALINSIGFIDAKDISILVGYWTRS